MTAAIWFFGVVGAALLLVIAAFAIAIGAREAMARLDRRNKRIVRERQERRG